MQCVALVYETCACFLRGWAITQGTHTWLVSCNNVRRPRSKTQLQQPMGIQCGLRVAKPCGLHIVRTEPWCGSLHCPSTCSLGTVEAQNLKQQLGTSCIVGSWVAQLRALGPDENIWTMSCRDPVFAKFLVSMHKHYGECVSAPPPHTEGCMQLPILATPEAAKQQDSI